MSELTMKIKENTSFSNRFFGCPEGQDARVLADMARDLSRDRKILIHVALDDGAAVALRSPVPDSWRRRAAVFAIK